MIAGLYANKIRVTVSDRSAPILEEVTLQFNQEQFVVILGHNGSGKSTLIKVLSGEKLPSSGSVLIDGLEITKMLAIKRAQDFVVLAQNAEEKFFLDLTLEENVALWESRFPKLEQLSFEQIMALTYAPERFLALGKQKVSSLSGGEKQSILLALTIAHPPKVLFLDEHTASLDPKASYEIMKATNQAIIDHKITAIMVTHNMDDAINYGDRLIVMNGGKIVIDQEKLPSFSKRDLKEIVDKIY